MKEELARLVESQPDRARLIAREYLQARTLETLQRRGAMLAIAFHGGTALRFLHSLPRYSEDLDFALERKDAAYDFRAWIDAVLRVFAAEGYAVDSKVDDRRTVHSAFVRFRGLLHGLGLSPHRQETLAIKIEIDTRPPVGAVLETSIVRRHVLLRLQHHDRASLLAGKLHAVLQRTYLKGRDLYDLLWYVSSPGWPAPNLSLLRHALDQTGWKGDPLTDENWAVAVSERVRGAAWPRVVADVAPFLEDPGGLELLSRENLLSALARRGGGPPA